MIEFALIAVPFFFLLFGTLEVGLVFWGTYELENATEDAARRIRTGQVASAVPPIDETGFKNLICARVSLLSQCATKLRIDVQNFNSFGALDDSVLDPFDGGGNLKNSFNYATGGPRSIVLVRSFYEWPLLTVMTSTVLRNMSNGNRLLRASAAFRNEPWPG